MLGLEGQLSTLVKPLCGAIGLVWLYWNGCETTSGRGRGSRSFQNMSRDLVDVDVLLIAEVVVLLRTPHNQVGRASRFVAISHPHHMFNELCNEHSD